MSELSEIEDLKVHIERVDRAIAASAIPSLLAAISAVQLAKVVLESAIVDRDRLKARLEHLEGNYSDRQ